MRNNYVVDGDVVRIELTQNQWALVDNDPIVLEKLYQHRWYANLREGKYYAVNMSRGRGKHILLPMHRLIVDAEFPHVVDHLSGNSLDNRMQNLRQTTRIANSLNMVITPNLSTGFRGVYHFKKQPNRPYGSTIQICGRNVYLGSYAEVEQAALLYDYAKVMLHESLSIYCIAENVLNFPDLLEDLKKNYFNYLTKHLSVKNFNKLQELIDLAVAKHIQIHSYVYLASNNQGFTKIGFTCDVERRNKDLKRGRVNGSDNTTEIIFSCKLQSEQRAREVERKLHQKYSKNRISRSEYFNLTKFQISEIIKELLNGC